MALITITSESNPDLFVDLIPADDPEGGYDGECSLCTWTLLADCGYFPDTADAVAASEVHVDHHHR